jgi:type II secretory ATPase GspE/PulE/Tfp pilus assembly ATPase PilB-like protein
MDNVNDDKQKELQDILRRVKESSEERRAQDLAKTLNLSYTDLTQTSVVVDALKLVPEEEAKEAQLAVIQSQGNKLAVLVYDPRLQKTKQTLDSLSQRGYKLNIFIVSPKTLDQAWSFYKLIAKHVAPISEKIEVEEGYFQDLLNRLTNIDAVKKEIENFDFKQFATARLVQIIIAGALANRASDIHTEPQENSVTIRYRIDGILHDITKTLSPSVYDSFLTRIKLLSAMKLNIHDQTQDGRFTIVMPKKEVEMRVSIIPSEFGETIVMRVLDPDAIHIKLEDLGMRPDDFKIAIEKINQPNGLILNTGPTGSGKTTTLYAFLQAIATPDVKVITVEDPIEYRIAGIEQTQVDEEAGYTFANGLRAILRQDPDIILIGEIRDKETAEIALQSALTGHIVFSTLHTNDSIGAVPRLMDLGIKPVILGPALSLVIAQRLVRKLCPYCKKPVEVSPELKSKIDKFVDNLPDRVDKNNYKNITLFDAVGCDKCNHTGFKGRIAIYEFFLGSRELEELINKKDFSNVDLEELAKKQGMVSLQQDGILKAISGITTLKEVEEITGTLKWE